MQRAEKYSVFVQDISKAQRTVAATKSPMNVSAASREEGGVRVCQMEKVSPDSSGWPSGWPWSFSMVTWTARVPNESVSFSKWHSELTADWRTTLNKFQSYAFCFMNRLTDTALPEPPRLKIFIAAFVASAITDCLHAPHFAAISLCPCRLEVTASRIRQRNQWWEAKSYQNHSRCVVPQPVWIREQMQMLTPKHSLLLLQQTVAILSTRRSKREKCRTFAQA